VTPVTASLGLDNNGPEPVVLVVIGALAFLAVFDAAFLLSLRERLCGPGGSAAVPRPARWAAAHASPPRLGGVALFLTLYGRARCFLINSCFAIQQCPTTPPPERRALGTLFVFIVGLIDDRFELAPGRSTSSSCPALIAIARSLSRR
jgi:hypothetical protein